jgi:DNA repair photolyase
MNTDITGMLEAGAVTPLQRLELVKQLKVEGLLAGVNAIPILPFISDSEEELEKIIVGARLANADYVLTGGLTLFGNQPADSRTLYFNFLKRYDPSLIPAYEKLYGGNFSPPATYLRELKRKSEKICAKYRIRTSILNADEKTNQRNTAGTQSKLF